MHEINKRPEIMASEEKTAAVSNGHKHLGTESFRVYKFVPPLL